MNKNWKTLATLAFGLSVTVVSGTATAGNGQILDLVSPFRAPGSLSVEVASSNSDGTHNLIVGNTKASPEDIIILDRLAKILEKTEGVSLDDVVYSINKKAGKIRVELDTHEVEFDIGTLSRLR